MSKANDQDLEDSYRRAALIEAFECDVLIRQKKLSYGKAVEAALKALEKAEREIVLAWLRNGRNA